MSSSPESPPYLRIAAELQRRITTGELQPGQRVPSTRELVQQWGVAMATATKALAALRERGWVRSVRGSGTVVSTPHRRRPGSSRQGEPTELSPRRLIQAAIALADAEGRSALSMRRLAAELGVGAMSLYRHVPDKDELLRRMADVALGEEELPEPGPAGWRAKLELLARVQWRAYRRHPWLAPTLLNSLAQPPVVPSGMRLVDWGLRALAGLGVDLVRTLYTVVALNAHVGGIAVTYAFEVETEQDTGLSSAQRQEADRNLVAELLSSGRFPALASLSNLPGPGDDLDGLFEFGLQRHLDGIATMLGRT